MIRFLEGIEPKKLMEAGAIEIPKIVAGEVKYWETIPLKTKDDFLTAYNKLEDENDHPGCAYLIAKFAKDKKVLQTVLYITAIHFTFGSIPYELQRLRHELTNPLYNKIVGRK